MAEVPVHIFGVRHHGPGSARSLVSGLETLQPDCVLIEGPPDADALIHLAASPEMQPPVALLVYDPELPQRSCFYPFAVFSPEWQAIKFALSRNLPVRFMDLPQSNQLAQPLASEKPAEDQQAEELAEAPSVHALEPDMIADPLMPLARAAGYTDAERWWEHMVEHRKDSTEIFPGILEAMAALREANIQTGQGHAYLQREALREAHMRQTIREGLKEGHKRIAVICGAWHGPALISFPPAKQDTALLKGLPKRKVVATWIPWTYSRLSLASGYGAGIISPGWYDFLWHNEDRDALGVAWLSRVARLLREEDLDASSASVIEAVRLAESLAALRGHSLPGLSEFNEATQAALCSGDALPLRLVSQKLIISERLGQTPPEAPTVPLAQDLAREQKRLRLLPEASFRQIDLDLRKPNDLDRSHLLHRLTLLGIPWGERQEQSGQQKGTFHELWDLQWNPEFAVNIIEAAIWGNTLGDAASGKVAHAAEHATDLQALIALLDSALLADLPLVAPRLIQRLQNISAIAADTGHLMDALPPLAAIFRYGNVRKTDSEMVGQVIDGLVARICVGLPAACASLNDQAAEEMFGRMNAAQSAVALLQNPEHTQNWNAVLLQLADGAAQHGLIAGRACRLSLDARQIDQRETARRVGLALSRANDPSHAAAWIDGFIRNSGILLLHDETLWKVLDDWVSSLSSEHFTSTLPLLRRTFSTFQTAERRQLGRRVAGGLSPGRTARSVQSGFDTNRADAALPLIARLLGLNLPD